jgi:hypothetical protein
LATIDQIVDCRDRWLAAISAGGLRPAFVEQTLRGCRESVEQLGARLTSHAYPVRTFLRPSVADLDKRLDALERHTQVPVPGILRAFWRIVGGITLVELGEYQHASYWSKHGLKRLSDGVWVYACDNDWLEYMHQEFEILVEDGDEEGFRYTLAPDSYHKDNVSGGAPYEAGPGDWAPSVENFDWTGRRRPITAPADPPDFVSYLRTAILECGGFPGFLGEDAFEEIRQELVRDLRPF